MANKVIVYSCLSDKIRAAIEEGRSFTVMGEIIMFTSAIRTLMSRGFNVKIVDSAQEFVREDVRGVVYYILDYLTIDHVKDRVLTPQKKHRIRFFCYWGRTPAEIPWTGLEPWQICIPFPYEQKPNTFLGFLMPDLGGGQLQRGNSSGLDPSIRGYLWGKEAKYFNRPLVNELGVQFYATCVNNTSEYKNITNLGLQPRDKYLDIIRHVDYVIGFGDPVAGPTIVETLELGKILIAPRRQIPTFLHTHPNIVLSDDLGPSGIRAVIRDIEAGHKYRSFEGVAEFHLDNYKQRLEKIFPSLPERRTCIIRSNMRDNNIFHFLVLEINAFWKFVARNNRVDYYLVLEDFNPSLASHRWRREVLGSLCSGVFVYGEAMPVHIYDNAIMDMQLQAQGQLLLESKQYIDYTPDENVIALARQVKNTHLGAGWESQVPSGMLLIQRKSGTRILRDADSDESLEVTLAATCSAAGIPFRCCYFEDMTFSEQLRAVHEAKWIVAAHGAAETNIIFAARGATLIEVNMRPHWYCDPVCDPHFSGRIGFDVACKGKLTYWPTYHKADYHNLAKLCGIGYKEVDPVRYGGKFVDRNPISKEFLYVRCADILRHYEGGVAGGVDN